MPASVDPGLDGIAADGAGGGGTTAGGGGVAGRRGAGRNLRRGTGWAAQAASSANEASAARPGRAKLTRPRRSRSAASWDRASRVSRRKVHRSRVCTASLSEPATTSPSALRVTAAMSASKRTVIDRHAALERRFGNHRLFDRDQPVVERQPVLLALLDGRGEGLVDMVVDMRAEASPGRPSRTLRGSGGRRPSILRGSGRRRSSGRRRGSRERPARPSAR